ncbi:M48 family metallopeptidase [Melittangium boletus]|uniref:M48 family metallopeptidase n=1 Tax=Melittangium boletus TaxID=83453 RepID=UPI003DA1CBF9
MSSELSLPSFLRVYALPALWLFALPLFGLWFGGHAMDRFDARVLAAVEEGYAKDASLTESERETALVFFRAVPASAACLSDSEELASFRQGMGEGCSDVEQFQGMRLVALGAIGLGLASAVLALLCALAAFVSRPLEYAGFMVGWNVLRVTGAVQAVAQGGLAVWLSYWMTAVWFQRYVPKLIIIVGVLAAMAVFKLLQAIFRRPAMDFEVEAEALEEARAPELWAHVRGLCARLGTPPPDHILAGIDTNFFVTEGEVRVGERVFTGRTLFVSLSLLRLLGKSEADAVLAHEMGHLLGGDTGHSKRLAPMLARFGQYLHALREGLVTLPIFHFMLAYRGLFELALSRGQRAAEFAADKLAAGLTSGQDIARSLMKVGAYANFRGRVESSLFEGNEQHQQVAIAERVALGFAEYAGSRTVHEDLYGSVTPHPFDSHPKLAARLENVGEKLEPDEVVKVLLTPGTDSWVSAILDAEAIEARLWGVYESRFSEAHDLMRAYRYVPSTPEEREHVEKHFPPLTFEAKEPGDPDVQLDFTGVNYSAWEEPVPFAQVKSVSTDERMFKKYLDIVLKDAGLFGGKRSICLSKMADGDALVNAYAQYLSRHRTMEAHQAQAQQAA